MPSILVTYARGDGEIATVARAVGAALDDRGFDVTVRPVGDVDENQLGDADGVLVGASVDARRHQPAVVTFAERYREVLAGRPSGLFQLSAAAGVPSQPARESARSWVDGLVAATGWHPDTVGLFERPATEPQSLSVTRVLRRLAPGVTTADAVIPLGEEFTDADAVAEFAASFGDLVAAERSSTLAGCVATKLLPGLAVLALAGLGYWLSRRGRGPRQETLEYVDRTGSAEADSADETGSADAGEPAS